jgi:aromatic ring hydroxylase
MMTATILSVFVPWNRVTVVRERRPEDVTP